MRLSMPRPSLLVPLMLCAMVALAFTGCKRGQAGAAQAPAERPPAPVTTAAAISKDVPVYLDAIGKTVAIETVSIVPQVGGKVLEAHVEDGAYVKKGQLLFTIDPAPFEATLAAAKATLAQNRAELDLARAEYKRVEELRPTNVISQLEFEQKKSALGVAEAKVEAAKAAIDKAQLDLDYTKITSPIDGRGGARWVDPGNIVRANEGTMYIIQRLEPIYAEFTVTENDLGTVRKFMAARNMAVGKESDLGLKALVDVPGDSARVLSALGSGSTRPTTQVGPREGKVTFLDNTVQSGTGTVKVRATLPNEDRFFWPGQFVNVRLVLTTRRDAVLVPTTAQQIGQQGAYVYVVGPDQTASLRPIKPGQRQGNLVVVEEGLQAGEKVITSGHMMVVPGGKVMVMNDAPGPSAPGTAQASN